MSGWELPAALVAIVLALAYAYGVSMKSQGKAKAQKKALEEGDEAQEREDDVVREVRGSALSDAQQRVSDRRSGGS